MGGGPIWNIFYLHCRVPERYPIYDQHAHRAMHFIQEHAICERDLTTRPAGVYESYRERYFPFVVEIREKTKCDLRSIDRALYTFG
jgi:hypothetical protein